MVGNTEGHQKAAQFFEDSAREINRTSMVGVAQGEGFIHESAYLIVVLGLSVKGRLFFEQLIRYIQSGGDKGLEKRIVAAAVDVHISQDDQVIFF
jgi:hypothetical protein